MTIHRRILLPTLCCVLLAACGQKGALYLPGNPGDARTSVPPTAGPASDAETASDDEPEDDDEAPRIP